MEKMNKKKENITTYEGGEAVSRDVCEQWLNMICSSFLSNQFYKNSSEVLFDFWNATIKVGEIYGWDFVARAAVFVRNTLGLRAVSYVLAGILNSKSFNHKRRFYKAICHRPDDAGEIFASVEKHSHAMVRGIKDYLETLDDYALMKYQMKNCKYNMYDLINLTHAHSEAIDRYKRGECELPHTWENVISNTDDKDKSWCDLVENRSLGYLALIRNIAKIFTAIQTTGRFELVDVLVEEITSEEKIKKSLVFPYQIYSAYKAYEQYTYDTGRYGIAIQVALNEAFTIASRMSAFDFLSKGNQKNLVVFDVSGSMTSTVSEKSTIRLCDVGACFAASMLFNSKDNFTLVKFGTYAKTMNMKGIIPFSIIEELAENDGCGYSTRLDAAFKEVNLMDFDRVFIISDLQLAYSVRDFTFKEDCHIYTVDLGSYPDVPEFSLSQRQVHPLTSLNPELFTIMPMLESKNNELFFEELKKDKYSF